MGELPIGQAQTWTAHRQPYLHIHATNVFPASTYARLSAEFAAILECSLSGATSGPKMVRSQPRYDALILAMNRQLSDRFAPLFTGQWIDHLSKLLGTPATSMVDGGLHHVPKGSRSGWVHTDLCSGWFDVSAASDRELNFADRSKCDYFTGALRNEAAVPSEYVRAATMIYYLNNDGWQHGDGGETELSGTSNGAGPRIAIAPESNSLILFECSPHSFHRLLGNPGRPRNSIILWLHNTADVAEARWGTAIQRRRAR